MKYIITCGLSYLLLFAANASADVAFSNFGENDETSLSGWGVGTNDSSSNDWHIAMEFVSNLSGKLDGIDIQVLKHLDTQGDISIRLWSHNDSLDLPDQVLWESTLPVSSAEDATADNLYPITNFGTSTFPAPNLVAGSSYWVSARGLNDGGFAWRRTLTQASQQRVISDRNGGTQWSEFETPQPPAFRVHVSAVPEPSTAALIFAISLPVFIGRRRCG